ncbi:MAG: enoyl-CoA hydratase/isomerase family protein [Hyphomicrobiaceae bacterium]|nr:enoyl-CoA hydratase/isomerase family protein [Hyphomicrobiaceae bacterium]MCC0023754.1 enoyl-CoA hydratase/isomerase family protein [Hyphomicrobiaceae bacterium]
MIEQINSDDAQHVEIEDIGKARVIRLNRPRAINALTLDMIIAIRAGLREAAERADIGLVLFEGIGEKGFCAGGDVRQVRQIVMDGDLDLVMDFFNAEYGMNRMIAEFDKPIVSLLHGYVMGGGIGVGCHGSHRFAAHDAKFAMPEGAIGYFCDIGARLLLAKAERHRALMFMLRGEPHGVGDAIKLNLLDFVVDAMRFDELRRDVIAAADDEDPYEALDAIGAQFGQDEGASPNCDFADQYAKWVSAPSYAETAFVCDPDRAGLELGEVGELILKRCPATHIVSFASLDAARADPDPERLFDAEVKLALLMAGRHDFLDGVRAVLVDKDHAPKWEEPDYSANSDFQIKLAAALQ